MLLGLDAFLFLHTHVELMAMICGVVIITFLKTRFIRERRFPQLFMVNAEAASKYTLLEKVG